MTVPESKKMKRFIPLENNPEVMSSLLHKLGLSPQLQFHDVFSIDDPDLLAFVPRPALALLLVFPVSDTYEKFRHEEDGSKPEYEGHGEGEEVIWYKQTIGNACGLIGLLHGVSNGDARMQVQEGSDLDSLIRKAIPLKPRERADLLEETDELEKAHQAAAATGDLVHGVLLCGVRPTGGRLITSIDIVSDRLDCHRGRRCKVGGEGQADTHRQE